MRPSPRVSVLVPTYRRPESLCRLLDSIEAAEASDLALDVVVIDNAGDAELELGSEKRRLPLRILKCPTRGKSRALNHGLAHTAADLVVFFDDDVSVDRLYFVELQGALSQWPDAAGFAGPVDPAWPVGGPPVSPWLLEYIVGFAYAAHDCREHRGDGLSGADPVENNMAFRRAWLSGEQTFDPETGPEAGRYRMGSGAVLFDRVRRTGGRIVHVPGLRVRHHVRSEQIKPGWILSRSHSYGRSLAHHGLRHVAISGNASFARLALQLGLRALRQAFFALRHKPDAALWARIDRKLIEGILAERLRRHP